MRTFIKRLSAAACAVGLLGGPARAEVAMTGTFTATQTCEAYQSFRKSTNPGGVKLQQNKTYDLLSKNKPDATHYRIVVDGAQPAERWVSTACGRVAEAGKAEPGTSTGAAANDDSSEERGAPAGRATHVLALGWQPAFCADHKGRTECRELTSTSFAGTHLTLHGLWPQPRGTQYCNVPSNLRDFDRDHDWDDLPEPEVSAATLRRLSAVMPGVQSKLQRHEWIVHGTCYGGNADSYFARAAGLAEAVASSKVSELFKSSAGKNVSANAIRAAFDDAFGKGAGERVAVSCNGRGENRKITELTIGLAGDVKGSAGIGDLMRAAQEIPPGCPGGLLERAPF